MTWQRLAGNHRAVAGLDKSKSSFALTVSRDRRGWAWEGRYVDRYGQLSTLTGIVEGVCAQAQVAAEAWLHERIKTRAEIERRLNLCRSLGQTEEAPA